VRDQEGVYQGVTHLIGLGHQKIGLLTFSGVALRDRGYQQALSDAGIPYDQTLVVSTQRADWRQACDAAMDLFRSHPEVTAVMVTADISAIGVLRASYLHGLRVPDDLAIVGFDNISLASAVSPALTTIAQPIRQIADSAVDLVVRQINGNGARPPCSQVLLDTQLIVRESCGGSPDDSGKARDAIAVSPLNAGLHPANMPE
jgi:DNA-binding LacI/PurR family transcriptional regulator